MSPTALSELPWGAVFCPPSASSPAAVPLSLARNLKQEPEPFEAEFDEDEFEDGEFVDFEVCVWRNRGWGTGYGACGTWYVSQIELI